MVRGCKGVGVTVGVGVGKGVAVGMGVGVSVGIGVSVGCDVGVCVALATAIGETVSSVLRVVFTAGAQAVSASIAHIISTKLNVFFFRMSIAFILGTTICPIH